MDGRRELTTAEKVQLLARMEAKYADAEGPEAARTPDRAWHELGIDLDEPDDTPTNAHGWATLARFFELLEQERPRWQADALCLEHPDVSFFPERGESTAAAKDVCDRCMVAQECGAYALQIAARDGVWAGASPRTLARRARAA